MAEIARNSKEIPIVECFKNNKLLFIAGSSWIPDEEILIPYFAKRKGWKLIIAPHVISEEHISSIMALLADRKVVRFTQLPTDKRVLKSADVLIIDCFGLLSSIYKYANVAYIGGGFEITNEKEFSLLMDKLCSDDSYIKYSADAAGSYVMSQIGATNKIMRIINLNGK